MLLPDQHHIEQIRQRLWCGREFGQAAVMVGSGFSRNADKTSATSPDFPLWWDLEEKMRSELPLGVVSANLDALELASEYEKAHGKQKLEQFLIESIPDKKYNPGKLHELLLSLPWSDVFTTNYDTLLERTFILDRKYDVIYNPADIPGRMKPRIVKLHGSFESYRPFIFTQQDYESYPTKFAPFVNIVQQSIMENAFCLIGFSGEDPNFLKWIEWVRNNLNEYSPPVYLCGLLNISNYQKQILKSRKVTTIDLSPLFPKSEWQDRSLRHSKALEWFFLNLMYGEPPDLTDWLSIHNKTRNQRKWKPSKGLPKIPPPSESLSNAENEVNQLKRKVNLKVSSANFLDRNSIRLEQYLVKLVGLWREQRQEYIKYKGWIILPRKYRNDLWNSTKEWISLIFDYLAQLSPPNNLLLLFELNWRLEKTLTPLIFNEWIEKIVSVVEQFNPYPNLIDLNQANITFNKKEYQQQDWQWENIQQAWVELAFALLRAGRDNHEQELFDLWLSRLENIVVQNSEWHSRWYYEQCLFYTYRLEQDRVLSIVETWESVTVPDFWQIRRASIVAQIGNLQEAQRIAQEALNKIRSCIQPDVVDYYLLSQEGWAMRLLKEIQEQIKWDQRKFSDDSDEAFFERWEQLEKYHCNPNRELEILEQEVTKPIPQAQALKKNKRSFLPGRTTRTLRFGTKALYPEFRPGFESLRILEEGGLPLSFINIQWHSNHITNATRWTIPFFPTWSFLALIQVSKSDLVKEWLSFIDIAILPQEEINYLYEILFGFLSKLVYQLTNLRINSSYKNEYLDSKLATFTETLSYLSIRLTSDKLYSLFDLSLKMYSMEAFRKGFCLQDCPRRLFKMLFYSLSQSEIIERLIILLELPIAGESGFEVSIASHFTDPFEFLTSVIWNEKLKQKNNLDRNKLSTSIERLINVVRFDISEVRKRASLRLSVLCDLEILTSQEKKSFAQALWNNFDPAASSNSLPENTRFHKFAFLILPEPQTGIAKDILSNETKGEFALLENYSLSSNISIGNIEQCFNNLSNVSTPLYKGQEHYDKCISWSSEAIEYLLEKINTWFERYKDSIDRLYQRKDNLLYDDLSKAVEKITACLSTVILPNLKDSEDTVKQQALNLINELEKIDISVLSVLPMTLFIDHSIVLNDIAKKLRFGLLSLNSEEIDNAIIGLQYWLTCSQQKQIPEPPPELLNDLINKLFYRRLPRLNFAIVVIGKLIKTFPDLLDESQLETLLSSLEFILQETQLPNNWQDWKLFNEDINSIIEIDDRPEYMRVSAFLAFQLYQVFNNKKIEIPKVLVDWKESCLNSAFPEVRKIWEEFD